MTGGLHSTDSNKRKPDETVEDFIMLRENDFQPGIVKLAKLSFKYEPYNLSMLKKFLKNLF